MDRRSFLAGVALVLGCSSPVEPEQTQPAAAPPAPVEPPPPPSSPVDPHGPSGLIKECEAELGDVPVALFGETVLVRLPVGVEVKEVAPMLAKMTASEAVSTCGAAVRHAAVGRADGQPKLPVTEIRDTILREYRGIDPTALRWSQDVAMDDRHYHGAYVQTGAPGVKGWFALRQKFGATVWMLLETDESAWPALERTFQQSSKRLLVVPTTPGPMKMDTKERPGGG